MEFLRASELRGCGRESLSEGSLALLSLGGKASCVLVPVDFSLAHKKTHWSGSLQWVSKQFSVYFRATLASHR
jgi:hypothetical protein